MCFSVCQIYLYKLVKMNVHLECGMQRLAGWYDTECNIDSWPPVQNPGPVDLRWPRKMGGYKKWRLSSMQPVAKHEPIFAELSKLINAASKFSSTLF